MLTITLVVISSNAQIVELVVILSPKSVPKHPRSTFTIFHFCLGFGVMNTNVYGGQVSTMFAL